jgi:hypothetical protein
MERFAMKCAFDPYTGCVMWIGGTTCGHGNQAPYGTFWDANRRWFAHRWAGHHIHGLDIDGKPVGHNCPAGPSTLCVEHVAGMTREENQEMIKSNPGRAFQDLATKQYWLLVSKGVERYEEVERQLPDVPFFDPPQWLRPFLIREERTDDYPF